MADNLVSLPINILVKVYLRLVTQTGTEPDLVTYVRDRVDEVVPTVLSLQSATVIDTVTTRLRYQGLNAVSADPNGIPQYVIYAIWWRDHRGLPDLGAMEE